MSEWILITVEAINGLATIVVTIVLTWVTRELAQRRRDREEMQSKAEQIVRLELSGHTTPLRTAIDNLAREIAGIHKRLEEGDNDFETIAERRESMSVQLEKKFGDLRVFMSDTFASKSDLKDHEKSVATKFDQVTRETGEIGKQVAVLASKNGSRAGGHP